MRSIHINDQIFTLSPQFYRGLIIVSDLTNHPSLKRVRKLLKKEIDNQIQLDPLADPRVTSWNEVHRQFGSDPEAYPPSITSLLKRIQSNSALPYINTAVALFNYISLKYCMPCGGDDSATVKGDLTLGFSDGTENFVALGSETEEHPEPGEVIYFDSASKNVMCRRWNWRNGNMTKILETTQQLVINIDCIPPCSPEQANTARDELANLLQEHCNATVTTDCLHLERRTVELPF